MRSLPARFAVALFAVLALTLASCVSPGTPASTSVADTRPDYSYWPQDVSDIKPDPAVRYGVLPNGVRYAIMRNVQPAGTISLRMRIASGSLQESDPQRGLAHFMEHMAFNGSKNVPEGEFVKLLQRKGLAFGAHTNAYTSTDETVYKLELPKNDADMIETGLMLFREVGDRLTLDPAAIEREKGVVLSEQRTRNTPEFRAFEARWRLWFEDQRLANRMPIGTVETIKGANRELLADYYRRFYRPERTFLVAVGDFDPADIEARIKAKFSDWQGDGGPTPDPAQGPVKQRDLVAASHVEPNLPENVSVTWFQPPNDAPDSAKERERNVRRIIAFAVVNRRLERMARDANAPFVSAGVDYDNSRGISQSVTLTVSSRPGQWKKAMTAAEIELRRAAEHGFQQVEIDRELKQLRAGLEDSLAKSSTRQTGSLANQIASTFGSQSVFSHPADQLARFEKFAPGVTPETALAALRQDMRGQGPVVFVSAGQAIEGGDAAVAAAYTASTKIAVTAPATRDAKEFPYTDFGKAGEVAERREDADVGVTLVRFANGVRLNVKRTDFEKDTIYVTARLAGGYVAMPPTKIGLQWALPFGFTEGGLQRLTATELEESLTGRIVSNDLDIGEQAFEFGGRTNARDMQLQMQLMTAYLVDPAYRGNGLERIQAAAENFIKQYSSGPGRVISREAPALLRSGDPRWAFPSLAQIKALTMADVEATLKPALAAAPLEISVVGDANVDEVIAAVGKTFGALSARDEKAAERPGARNVRFPAAGRKLRFTHEGRPDQASAYAAWPAPDFYSSPRRARTISLLREMIKVRMIDEFREAQGATYSPSVSGWSSDALPDFGFIVATAETPPGKVESFYKTLDAIVAEMKAGAFSDDVIARARAPMLKSIETDRRTNRFWIGAIEDVGSDPRSLDSIKTQLPDLESITKAELVAAAKTYLDDKRRLDIRVLPKQVQAAAVPARAPSRSAAEGRELALQH